MAAWRHAVRGSGLDRRTDRPVAVAHRAVHDRPAAGGRLPLRRGRRAVAARFRRVARRPDRGLRGGAGDPGGGPVLAGRRLRRRVVHRAHGPAPAADAAWRLRCSRWAPRSRWRCARVRRRCADGSRRSLRSPVAAFFATPIVGWTLFVGVPVFVHASPLFDVALRSTPWHAVEHGLWMTAALIFWWPIVGVDPNPHPVRWPVRMLSLFLAMPAMSFLALGIYAGDVPLYPTYANAAGAVGPRGARRSARRRRDDVARRQPGVGAGDPVGRGRLEARRGCSPAPARGTRGPGRSHRGLEPGVNRRQSVGRSTATASTS